MGPVLHYGQDWGRGEQAHSELTHQSFSWRQHSAGPDLIQESNSWLKLSEDPWSRQTVEVTTTEALSSLADSPLLVALLVSTVIVAAQLLPLIITELNLLAPRLENHEMCGITTKGQVNY